MGQYQQPIWIIRAVYWNLQYAIHKYSNPCSIFFGIWVLWNNPAVGRVTFGKNYTEWIANSTKDMDYWITVADTPKQILYNYTAVTGRADMFLTILWDYGSVNCVTELRGSLVCSTKIQGRRYKDRYDCY